MHSRREQLCTTPVVWMVVCPCFKLNTDDFDNRAFREVGSETEIQSRNRRNYRHSSPFIAASNTPAEHRRSKSYSIQSPTRLAMRAQLASVCERERECLYLLVAERLHGCAPQRPARRHVFQICLGFLRREIASSVETSCIYGLSVPLPPHERHTHA